MSLCVRCTWFCCSGFLGSCGWSVQERERRPFLPAARQTLRASPLLPPSPHQCLPTSPRASTPCRPAWLSSTTLCHSHCPTGPTLRLLSSLIPALIHIHSPTVIYFTWASRPLQSWSHFRGAEQQVMGGSTVVELRKTEQQKEEGDRLEIHLSITTSHL